MSTRPKKPAKKSAPKAAAAKPAAPRPVAPSSAAAKPEPAKEATKWVGSQLSRNRGATLLIGALLAILGFALAVQLRSQASTDSLSGAREEDLVRILDDQNSQIDRLQNQISDLQAAKQRLSDSGSNTAAARQEAQSQADALAILTGTAPAHGPGVRISITDPGHKLKAEDLLDVIEELRGAGAEVIQFGPVRVAAGSAFTDATSGVVLDGTALQAPYTVLAIGDPKTMDTALNIQGGVVNSVGAAGGQVAVNEQDSLGITATRPTATPKYASPAPK
jgi:uncharacterized protein YlxW (UPF0749 family)